MGIPVVDIHGDRQTGKSYLLEALVARDLLQSYRGVSALYVTDSMHTARLRCAEILRLVPPAAGSWNSRKDTIKTGMSHVRFTSYRSLAQGSGRGYNLDTLYLDEYRDDDITEKVMESLYPCLAASSAPHIYRAHWSDKTDCLD